MGYGVINGQAINGDDNGVVNYAFTPAGVDAVASLVAVANASAAAQGARPAEIGELGTRSPLTFAGMDAVQTGTHTGLFNVLILPAGIDAISTGPASTDVVASALPALPVDFGAVRAQNGVDVTFSPLGIDTVRQGLHSALAGQPPPAVVGEAGSARPLQFGDLVAQQQGVVVEAAGASPADVGAISAGQALYAEGAFAAEVGGVSRVIALSALSARCTDFGHLGLRFAIAPSGASVGAAGTHAALLSATEVLPAGAIVAEIGGMPPFADVVIARASFPLAFGPLSISRGATC